jgi:hypothetical protein
MSDAECFARPVLLLHRDREWTPQARVKGRPVRPQASDRVYPEPTVK